MPKTETTFCCFWCKTPFPSFVGKGVHEQSCEMRQEEYRRMLKEAVERNVFHGAI